MEANPNSRKSWQFGFNTSAVGSLRHTHCAQHTHSRSSMQRTPLLQRARSGAFGQQQQLQAHLASKAAALPVLTDASETRPDLGGRRHYDTTNRPAKRQRSEYSREIPTHDPTQTQCCARRKCNEILQLWWTPMHKSAHTQSSWIGWHDI